MSKKKLNNDTKNPFYTITNSAGNAVIKLHGQIGGFEKGDPNYKEFSAAIDNLIAEQSPKVITVLINSVGGSVFQGYAIYDLLKNCGVTIHTHVEGLAASMASVIMMAGEKRTITKNSRVMIHKPQATTAGEADALEDMAKLMRDMEEQLLDTYADVTGKDRSVFVAMMKPNRKTWLNAKRAYELGLVTQEPMDGKTFTTKGIPVNATEEEVFNLYNSAEDQEIKNKSINNSMKFKIAIMALLGTFGVTNSLKEDGDDNSFLAAIKNLVGEKDTEITNLKNEVNTLKGVNAEALVNSLVEAGKIKEDAKEAWVEKATKDYDTIKDLFDGLETPEAKPKPTQTDINNALEKGKKPGADDKGPENRAEWSFDDYATKDPKALAEMEHTDADAFNELVSAKQASVRAEGMIK